tara:strand:+ start:13816 stop:14049 length:234 start_codon:yes stop_codon:yes gene_type:complete
MGNTFLFIILSVIIIFIYHYFSESIKNNFKETKTIHNDKYKEIIEELKTIEETQINYESMEDELTKYAMEEINNIEK